MINVLAAGILFVFCDGKRNVELGGKISQRPKLKEIVSIFLTIHFKSDKNGVFLDFKHFLKREVIAFRIPQQPDFKLSILRSSFRAAVYNGGLPREPKSPCRVRRDATG